MDWIKLNKEGEIEFNSEEVKLVPELQTILSLKYNKGPKDHDGRKRYRATDEIKYMYLAYSPKSPYKDFYEDERIAEAKIDCKFPKEWKESEELQALIVKFKSGSVSKITRALATAERFLEKFEKHLNSIDLNERNQMSSAVIHDPKKIMDTLKSLPDFLTTIHELEKAARNDVIAAPKSKGDHELGWMAMNKTNNGKQRKEESEQDGVSN